MSEQDSEFTGEHVNVVLRTVAQMTDNGDAQLSILSIALVTGARSVGIPEAKVLEVLKGIFANPPAMTPLKPARN